MAERVYISSTYEDLKEFRQATINCVVSLVDYYVPISMEFYDAEDQHFVAKCLNDVANSDIYILLLGKRYGYRPRGFAESITELEFNKAINLQQGGHPIQILVFRASEFCFEYDYDENNDFFIAYQQQFLIEIGERLSPKPFDSAADLKHQVYHSLMKRLLKRIKNNPSIVAPDKDNLICFCDRTIQLNQLKEGVWRDKKRLFFLQGSRKIDLPNTVLNRFSKFILNFEIKLEPSIKITDLFMSTVKAKNTESALSSILEYLHINFEFTAKIGVDGFVNRLADLKYKRIIIPFYFDLDIDRLDKDSSQKLKDFFDLINQILTVHQEKKPGYELYIMVLLFRKDPATSYTDELKKNLSESNIEDVSLSIAPLGKINENDISDWLEKYFVSALYSGTVMGKYFPEGNEQYAMQEAAIRLKMLLDDLTAGKEELLQYIND